MMLREQTDMRVPEVRKAGCVNSEALSPSPSKRKQQVEGKEECEEPSESWAKASGSQETSPWRPDNSSPSLSPEAKGSRQKGSGQRSGGSSHRQHQGRGHLEERRRKRPPPSRERGRDKTESTPANHDQARDSRHKKPAHVKDRSSHPRSSTRSSVKLSSSLSGDARAAAPAHKSPKRSRQHSPAALSSRALTPLSRVVTHMGALEVALEELLVPGGAFLHNVPSSSTELTVSQRTWLTWQLSQAGTALHWANHTVDCILAAQGWLHR